MDVTARPVALGTDARARWLWLWLEHLVQDVRYGCRLLVKNPGFTIIAVLSLALGIGANSAVFSWADALLLRPLPVPRPGEVLTVGSPFSLEGLASGLAASYRDYVDVRDRSKSFAGLVAFTGTTVGLATKPDASPRLRIGLLVSGNFFPVMGVEPQLGRAFRADEDQVPGRDAVVVLGHDFWSRQFGSDPSVLGRKIHLNGVEFTVIGVAPESFPGMNQYVRYDFYAPLMMWPRLMTDQKMKPLEARDARFINVKGRLRPGVTLSQAQAELSVIAKDLERAYPDTNKKRTLLVRTEMQERFSSDQPDVMLIAMLMTLSGAVLFVACANIAGLLTSRAPVRAREVALRLAVGAGRPRLMRQFITESLLIGVLGGVLGLGVGYASMLIFRRIQIPTDLPVMIAFQLDRRAFVFGLIVSVVSVVLFGVAPAIRAARADLTSVLKSTDAVGVSRRRWGRGLLVGAQVAVSVVLLALATFMYRGFQRQLGSGPGYRLDHLLMMSLDPSLVRYTEAQTRQFFDQVADRARAVPGVKSVSLASSIPMSNDGQNAFSIRPEGFQFPEGKDSGTTLGVLVDDRYFDTLQLSIVKGRGVQITDSADAPKVAVINEHLADHYWPGQDPIGKRFRVDSDKGPWIQVVGLAKTSKYIFLAETPMDYVYLPFKQQPAQRMVVLAESMGDPASLADPLREVVRSLDVNQPIYNVRTMEEFYQMRTISIFNIIIGLVASMGLIGLILSFVGLYGLVAYTVGRRTKEIGIRMAIGADRSAVLLMVLRQGFLLALGGLAVGLIGSLGAGRALRAMFPGGGGDTPGSSTPGLSLLIVGIVVVVVTFLASYIPARRAARINPTQALRYE